MSKLVIAAALLCAGGEAHSDFRIGPGSMAVEVSYERQRIDCSAMVYVDLNPVEVGVVFQYQTENLELTISCDTRKGIICRIAPVKLVDKDGD